MTRPILMPTNHQELLDLYIYDVLADSAERSRYPRHYYKALLEYRQWAENYVEAHQLAVPDVEFWKDITELEKNLSEEDLAWAKNMKDHY